MKSGSNGDYVMDRSKNAAKGGRATAKSDCPRCNAHNRQGDGRCRLFAGAGTDHVGFGHCKHHGGSTPNGKRHAALLEAQADIPFMGTAIDVDPAEALLAAVRITAGQAAYAGQRVAALDPDEDEALHSGWVTFHGQLVERLARYSAMAISAGVAERLVAAAERWGDELAQLFRSVFADLGLELEGAEDVIRRHLLEFDNTVERPVLDISRDSPRVTEHLERVKRLTKT